MITENYQNPYLDKVAEEDEDEAEEEDKKEKETGI
jgi:hypothetical protein